MSMPGRGEGVNLNVRLRTDARPEQLLKEILLSPLIYIRLLGILFSTIVFGCVSSRVLVPDPLGYTVEVCLYSGVYTACTLPIAVGVVGFLLCIVFIIKDIVYVVTDFSESPVIKKVVLLVDAIVNGFWGLMWFVCFCLTADKLRQAYNANTIPDHGCADSGVVFSFFSVLAWGAMVAVNIFLFVRLIRSGTGDRTGYASIPEGGARGDNGDQHKSYAAPEY